MIKTVIFDIGNVLTVFRWREFFREFGYTEEIYKRVIQATVKNPAWSEYDRGIMSDEEVLKAFIQYDPEIGEQIKEALTNIRGIVEKCDYAIPWIRELKERGLQVLVLSNFSRKAFEECSDALDFMPEVDGGIMSYRDGLIKPEPEIYRLILSRYNLNPGEAVFLDDMEVNVEAARAEGIRGIVFRTYSQAKEELEALLA